MLYPAQQQAVNDLKQAIQIPHHISDHHLWISGEMGVGKTYIASALAHEFNARHVLIVSPATVTEKWAKVFHEFNPTIDSHIYQPRKDEKKLFNQAGLTIVDHRNLFKFVVQQHFLLNDQNVEYFADKLKDINRGHYNDVQNYGITKQTAIDNVFEKQGYDLIIIDEIHTVRPTIQEYAALNYLFQSLSCPMLALTGTVFNQNIENLAQLLCDFNPSLMSCFQTIFDIRYCIENPASFYQQIWRYCAVQISLNNVEDLHRQDDIKQEIMPLNGIELSLEQQAWISIVQANVTDRGDTYKNRVICRYLDRPTEDQPTITSRRSISNVTSNLNLPADGKHFQKSFISMQLTPTKLIDTPKFKQTQAILEKYPEKTLIFVEDKKLIKDLAQHLPHADYLPNNLKKAKYSQYINDALNDGTDIFIVTTSQISVGVDIDTASQIIWYQVPNDVAQIIQAQRRIYRLTSTKSSRIFYLFYKATHQEEIIKEVSQSAVHNAATYNVRQNDKLAQLTKILFPNLKGETESWSNQRSQLMSKNCWPNYCPMMKLIRLMWSTSTKFLMNPHRGWISSPQLI